MVTSDHLPYQVQGRSPSDEGASAPRAQRPNSHLSAGTVLRADSSEAQPRKEDASGGEDQGNRRYFRHPVQACRPVFVQLLNADGQPGCDWVTADILDISLGGICLLVSDDIDPESFPYAHLDLRPQPGFVDPHPPVELRWFVKSQFVVTLGLRFPTELYSLPRLV